MVLYLDALEPAEFVGDFAFAGSFDALLDAGVVAFFGRVGHVGSDGVEGDRAAFR